MENADNNTPLSSPLYSGGDLDAVCSDPQQAKRLLHALTGIESDLGFDPTLRHIVAASLDLTGCRYGAIAAYDGSGRVTSVVHLGMSAELVDHITHPVDGAGVIRAVLAGQSSLRLDDLSVHPSASGLVDAESRLRAFLGTPILFRGSVFGGLFLIDDRAGWKFSRSDEAVIRILTSAAAAAIDNARLYERSERRAEWIAASRGIITELLLGSNATQRPLQLIARQLQKLTNAEQAIVLTPADADASLDGAETLVVSAAVGHHASDVIGQEVPVDGSTTGHVFRSGTSVITESFRYPIPSFTDAGERSAIVMPLCYEHTVRGVIAVARSIGDTPFDASYLDAVGDFASHAAIALVLATNGENARELSILADRERIAHDLHDYVIQRLFAIGLDVQGTIARAKSSDIVARLNNTIDDLQSTIENIRTTIFELQSPTETDGFRRRIQDAVANLTDNRNISTTLHLSGPLTAVGPRLAQQAEAALAEALSNAVRHSGATHLNVSVTVADDLSIDVVDDGCGIPPDNRRRSGLANMSRRAEQAGGSCSISSAPAGGTAVHWTAPLLDS